MNDTLLVCELFRSIQGESTFAGSVCTFVRLTGCNLSCEYCDTPYARSEGRVMRFSSLIERITTFSCNLIEITGGEPLLQQGTAPFVRLLVAAGKKVLVETNGSLDIGVLPEGCIRIVDVKCPSSGMCGSFLERNIAWLCSTDELKFVIGSREDFDWATAFLREHRLPAQMPVLFSPVTGTLAPGLLAEWILEGTIPVRLHLQLHKILWGDKRGV